MSYNTGIYIITNTINNKCYIGSAADIKTRWRGHKSRLFNNKHHSSKLQNSYNKYGVEAFKYDILLYCSKKDLIMYEQNIINKYKSEYNICSVAKSCLGVKRSKETRAKMSIAQTGNKKSLGHKLTTEQKIDLISRNKGNKYALGNKLTNEAKAKISVAKKGNKHNLGRKHTEETKEKMRLACANRKGK